MNKNDLQHFFRYLIYNNKTLELSNYQIKVLFYLTTMMDNNYCSPNLTYRSNAVGLIALHCGTHPAIILEILKELTQKGFLIRTYPQYGYYYTFAIKKISSLYNFHLNSDLNFRKEVVNTNFFTALCNESYFINLL